MGLGRLNPGCGSDCNEGCGYFCHGRKGATIRITGGIGCTAEVNGDFIVPRFYPCNESGNPNSPFIGPAGADACGYFGWVGSNSLSGLITCFYDCATGGLADSCCGSIVPIVCSGGGVAYTTTNYGAPVHLIQDDYITFQIVYRTNQGGQLQISSRYSAWAGGYPWQDFPLTDRCTSYEGTPVPPGLSCRPINFGTIVVTWEWTFPFGYSPSVAAATHIYVPGYPGLIVADSLDAVIFIE